MPIDARFTCVATGASVRVPIPTSHGIDYEDSDDAILLPLGWGEVRIRRMVENPECATVRSLRAAEQATLDAMIADPDVPDDRKSPELIAAFAAKLDEMYPLPEPATVFRSMTWYPLASGAIDQTLKAMETAGFPALTE